MATYAIGDIQGCYEALMRLVEKIAFNPTQDQLWFTGDLVNRGPASVKVLRWVRAQGSAVITVLGNHDLHLLSVAYKQMPQRSQDTFEDVLNATDRDELLEWLCHRPLLHYDPHYSITLIHAGLPPQWNLNEAKMYAAEVEDSLRGTQRKKLLGHLYGANPNCWSPGLKGWERLRFISNCLTRLRCCTNDGCLSLDYKGPPNHGPDGYMPWFLIPGRRSAQETFIFGHWSTLGYHHGPGIYALDTGCVWGGRLTAICLDKPNAIYHVECS